MPPVEQVFFGGEFFEARLLLEKLMKSAQKRIIIIDEYIDAATFDMLDVRANVVTADIYSNGLHTTLRDAHNAATGVMPVQTHKWTNPSHDRWLIINDCLYHCGHSLKDMGRTGEGFVWTLDSYELSVFDKQWREKKRVLSRNICMKSEKTFVLSL